MPVSVFELDDVTVTVGLYVDVPVSDVDADDVSVSLADDDELCVCVWLDVADWEKGADLVPEADRVRVAVAEDVLERVSVLVPERVPEGVVVAIGVPV